ncbi:hypothetical protein [Epilithonimonas caeni]|uniref:hypothetical protein n=1 Tax=Epilithonimonas caeni TaxID=365343 RepID=UPI00040E01A6|nr:hypothetical protein [Epilithonimonas caeni]
MFYSDTGFELVDFEQDLNPEGQKTRYLNTGFAFIIETYNQFGFEGEIEYILKKNNSQFIIGLLDMANPDTDGLTYFGCTLIQNTNISDYKKQLSTSIDLFSTKDIDGKPISPAPTIKVLRKALPIYTRSFWSVKDTWNERMFSAENKDTLYSYFNPCVNNVVSEITNSNTGGSEMHQITIPDDAWDNNAGSLMIAADNVAKSMFAYVNSTKFMVDTEITIDNFSFSIDGSHGGGSATGGTATTNFQIAWGYNLKDVLGTNSPMPPRTGDMGGQVFFQSTIGSHDGHFDFNMGKTVIKIPDLPIGAKIWIFFNSFVRHKTGGNTVRFKHTISNFTIDIKTTQKALDNVISTVRYIDVLKQCSKFIKGVPVNAPLFDIGGEHYNNVCWNRAMLSMNTSNSKELISETLPEGLFLGEIVNNTLADSMELGYYFWNGLKWILLNESEITKRNLISNTEPSGTLGELIYNTNKMVEPSGLCYWSGSAWVGLEYARPFVTNFQDAYENSMAIEACADYEINENEIYFGKYGDFYRDVKLASFPMASGKNYKEEWNDRFKINNVLIGYDTYETNRLSKNTTNDIHTSAEWSLPNSKVENKFERSIKYVRSGFSSQAIIDLETKTPATADDDDDKVFINSVVPLESGIACEFSANLQMSISGGNLLLSNFSENSSTSDVTINWNMRGLKVGDDFKIKEGHNSGDYEILSITQVTLTLKPIGHTPTYNETSAITIYYVYQDVNFQTATNEGFDLIQNLASPTLYPNLDYSIRRNFDRWNNFFSTACSFSRNQSINNLYFKNNPPLESQKTNGILVKEMGSINCVNLPEPILTPKFLNVEVYADFELFLKMMEDYKNLDAENCRGYIECFDEVGNVITGYPFEVDYTWKTGTLKLKLEQRNDKELRYKIFDKTFSDAFE